MALPVNPVFITDAGDIFDEIGVDAIYTSPGGVRDNMKIIVGQETATAPTGYENFNTEQRTTVSVLLAVMPNRKRAPSGGLFDVICGGPRYIVDDGDSEAVQDLVVATHIVRQISD